MREVRVGIGRRVVDLRGQLVGGRVENQPVDVLQVEVRLHQFLREVGEQFRIAGRIVWPDVIGLVDNAAAQEPRPHAIDDAGGEVGILRCGQPGRKDLAGIAIRRQRDRRAVRERGRARPSRGCAGGGLVRIEVHDLLFPFLRVFVANGREKRGHAGESIFRPCVGARAHERQRDG